MGLPPGQGRVRLRWFAGGDGAGWEVNHLSSFLKLQRPICATVFQLSLITPYFHMLVSIFQTKWRCTITEIAIILEIKQI